MDKTYNPAAVEKQRYAFWKDGGYFAAQPEKRAGAEPYVIVIPPPNVTAALHMGHALDNVIQDFLIRYKRMRGFDACWVPGTDHAGIATQTVVEKRLLAETGKTRDEIGRETLVREIWAWKDRYEARILGQLESLGCSCDWDRKRFTLDEVCSRAVRRTFLKMFKDGLIYRGKRLVNWDPATRSALADDEVEHVTVKGGFWHIKYPVVNPGPSDPKDITVATTRPETMLGDTAVAVHPDDERYRGLVGKSVLLPLMNREIPIIADPWADPEKGSGCVKITPAHDPNDYEVWQRHPELWENGRIHDVPSILKADGTINRAGGKYVGLDRFEARTQVVADLHAQGLIDTFEEIEHEVGHSYRSHVPVEPYLSDQWFVKVGPLAKPALQALRGGQLRFIPERYAKTYDDWLSNLRDWCISRQLWWGHRIPIWTYHETTPAAGSERGNGDKELRRTFGEPGDTVFWRYDQEAHDAGDAGRWQVCSVVDLDSADDLRAIGVEPSRVLPSEGQPPPPTPLQRDPDVLDTWFSSALWPHSVFGWPEETADLKRYYPGSTLVTGRDIITLWVSRMVMSGLYNLGDVPFHDVFIHAILHDGAGHRMSKSKGNGVDPLEIIDTYGADALRYVVAEMSTGAQDVRLPVFADCPECEGSRDLTEYSEKKADLMRTVIACRECGAKYKVSAQAQGNVPVARRITSKRFEVGRNFCNKLWNSARLALSHLDPEDRWSPPAGKKSPHVEDRWILSRLNAVVRQVGDAFDAYAFATAAGALYHFHWDEVCDWYLEIIKPRLREGDAASRRWARWTLARVLDRELRLLHPITPHVTEEIWQRLRDAAPETGEWGPALIVARWPEPDPAATDGEAEDQMRLFQDVVRAARDIRAANRIPWDRRLPAMINAQGEKQAAWLREQESAFLSLVRGESMEVGVGLEKPAGAATAMTEGAVVHVPLRGLIDVAAERKKIEKNIAKKETHIAGIEKKLSNPGFLKGAPDAVVEAERGRLEKARAELAALRENLGALGEAGEG